MARKNASASKTSNTSKTSKTKKAAIVAATVASIVGYDPTMLLAAPVPHHIDAAEVEVIANTTEVLSEADAALGADVAQASENTEVRAEVVPAGWSEIEAGLEAKVLNEIAADDAAAVQEILPATLPPAESFKTAFAEFDTPAIEASLSRVLVEIEERRHHEMRKNPENENIQRTLRNVRQAFSSDHAQRVLMACNVTPEFINHSLALQGTRMRLHEMPTIG